MPEDTSVRLPKETVALFKSLAGPKPLKDYLAELAVREDQKRALDTATEAFRRVINEPGTVEAFDTEFGGLPEAADHHPQAA